MVVSVTLSADWRPRSFQDGILLRRRLQLARFNQFLSHRLLNCHPHPHQRPDLEMPLLRLFLWLSFLALFPLLRLNIAHPLEDGPPDHAARVVRGAHRVLHPPAQAKKCTPSYPYLLFPLQLPPSHPLQMNHPPSHSSHLSPTPQPVQPSARLVTLTSTSATLSN